ADLIDANTQGQRHQALRQMKGGLRDQYEQWRSDILDALAFVEGEIDFPDEEDVPDALAKRAGPGLFNLSEKLSKALAESGRGERVRHGVDIAIIGEPNSGKSSIINRLAGREAAIVSDEAGTTRDIVEVHMELANLPVRMSDTAGLRDTSNKVEAEGVRRALLRAEDADLRILVVDTRSTSMSLGTETLMPGDFLVYNKADLGNENPSGEENVSRETFLISAKTGEGFYDLVIGLERVVRERFGATEQAGLTRVRHRDCVRRAMQSVTKAYQNLSVAPELSGAELRVALHAIKELAGEADIEAVLDRVFSSFCIGK
ncbi:MAG: GTP-binding protein, partial [Acidimicrobiales bacterium]